MAASVGIVTPIYNQADYVEESIKSILSQDYPNITYIVVNDGSRDRTVEVVSGIEGDFKFVDQTNRGQASTLNEQWSQLQTKYLAYLSSDDLLSRDVISKAVEIMEAEPSVACVFPDFDVIDENGRIIKRSVGEPFDVVHSIVSQRCNIGPGAVFRKSAFEAAGGWRADMKLAPDWEFWIRLQRFGDIRFRAEVGGYYRLHTGSYSVKEVSEERSLEYVRVLDDYFLKSPDPRFVAKKGEAYANAYLFVARNAFRRADPQNGIRALRQARRHDPRSINPFALARLFRNVISKPIRIVIAKASRKKRER